MDADKEILEFVDTLETKETVEDIWSDISNALETWTNRILDAEAQHSKSKQYQQVVEEALQRQQSDGLLSHHDYTELIDIASLWNNLLNATSTFTLGCFAVKRDIIAILLEIYTLKQVTKHMFIEACLKL